MAHFADAARRNLPYLGIHHLHGHVSSVTDVAQPPNDDAELKSPSPGRMRSASAATPVAGPSCRKAARGTDCRRRDSPGLPTCSGRYSNETRRNTAEAAGCPISATSEAAVCRLLASEARPWNLKPRASPPRPLAGQPPQARIRTRSRSCCESRPRYRRPPPAFRRRAFGRGRVAWRSFPNGLCETRPDW